MTTPLGFVVCGAPLAARSVDVAAARGWELAIGVTQAGAEWIDPDRLSEAAEREISLRRRWALALPSSPRSW